MFGLKSCSWQRRNVVLCGKVLKQNCSARLGGTQGERAGQLIFPKFWRAPTIIVLRLLLFITIIYIIGTVIIYVLNCLVLFIFQIDI